MITYDYINNVVEVEGTKLFVFGDSYVDTGNFMNSKGYMFPYGITFPGTPSGRFGDGRILTDYIGNILFPLFAPLSPKDILEENTRDTEPKYKKSKIY
ncbi:putative acetylajmaline esterase [Lupinus albus]|uniref:Putative acetylajmaline esterase n=1 Tax=Lupinus albus TaxID=3870 RepID=A0A6A4QWR0_LUPAL|nr:putative acetylajmaline esterase [Lupinus albus]